MKKSFAVKKLTSAEMAKALTSNVHDDIFSSFFNTEMGKNVCKSHFYATNNILPSPGCVVLF
jgi:hypothetical protein